MTLTQYLLGATSAVSRTTAMLTMLSAVEMASDYEDIYASVWAEYIACKRDSELDRAVKALGGISGAAAALHQHWTLCPVKFH